MKRLISILFILALFIIPAAADLIFEPYDEFYSSHSDECEYENRKYIANGDDGYAYVYKNPTGQKTLFQLKNQKVVSISWCYTDENSQRWGLLDTSGWVKLSQFIVKYDTKSFYDDFKDKFKPYNDELKGYEIKEAILFWEYPGAEEAFYEFKNVDYSPEFQYTYTDNNNQLWGYAIYFWGVRDFWVCLSDPENADLPVMEINYDNLNDSKEPKSGLSPLTIALILVSIVIAITAVLIPLLYKKKNKVKDDESSPAP